MVSFKNSTTYTHESELWPDEVISDIHTAEEFKDFSFSASSFASLELLVKKIHNFCFMCFHSFGNIRKEYNRVLASDDRLEQTGCRRSPVQTYNLLFGESA